jgi:hypothetical protein
MSTSLPNIFVNLKQLPILIGFLLCSLVAFSQTSYTWTGAVDNNWATSGNWSPARTTAAVSDHLFINSGGTVEITGVITQSIDRLVVSGNTALTLIATVANQNLSVRNGSAAIDLQVQSGSSLTVGTNVNLTMQAISQFEVQSAATLNIAAARTFTVTATVGTGGAFDGTLNLEGIVSMNAPASVAFNGTFNNLPTSGAITTAIASLQFTSTAKYNHLRAGGVFPAATWHADSEVLVIVPAGATGNIGIPASQTFGKFTYDSPDQNTTVSLGFGSPSSFAGDFDVISTGTGAMSFAAAATVVNIAGDLNIEGTSNVLMNTGAAVATTLNIVGDFNLNEDASFARGTATSNQLIVFTISASPSYFNNNGAYNGTGIGLTVNAGATLHLVNDVPSTAVNTVIGTLYFNNKKFTGTGTFTANVATTHLYIDQPEGLPLGTASAGNIQMTGAKAYGLASNYYYVGTSPQIMGAGFPMGNYTGTITIDNPTSVSLSTNVTMTAGTFNFNAGNLILGAYTLQVHTNTSFVGSGYDNDHMVVADGTGQLKLGIFGSSTPEFVYPIGDSNGNYTPVALEIVSAGGTRILGVNLVLAAHPASMGSANYVARYWSFTNNLAGNPVVNATFTYVPSDVVGTLSAMTLQRYNTTPSWSTINSSQAGNTFTITGEAGFVNPAAATAFDIVARSGFGITYRTKGNGNWNDLANWEYGANPSGPWTNATVLPTNANSDRIEVVNGHTVTVTAAATADDVEVNGTLVIASAITFTVANGPALFDMVVNGKVVNGNAATIGTITTSGAIQFAAGSTYEHAKPAGTIPTATWDVNSTCLITGATTALPGGLPQFFGHFIWNSPSQTSNIPFFTGAATLNVAGDFSVINTGTGYINFIAGTTQSATLNVGRDFKMVGGTFVSKMGTSGTGTLNISGKYRQTGGTMRLYAGTTTGGGALVVSDSLLLLGGMLDMSSATTVSVSSINVLGHFYQNGGELTVTGTGASNNALNLNGPATTYTYGSGTHNNAKINYVVNNGADVTLNSPINPAASRTVTVQAGGMLRMNGTNMLFANAGSMSVSGTLDLGTSVISNTTGATTFTLASGGTLLIGSPDGITSTGATGNIQVSSTRSYNAAGRYIYNGATAQVTGNGLPGTISGANGYLEINNAAGVTLTSATSITATGLEGFKLTAGQLSLGNNNLTIATATPFAGNFSDASHIVTNGTGQLVRTFATTSPSFTYPIGDGTAYTPVSLGFTLNGVGNVGFGVVNSAHPNLAAPADHLNRYFVSSSTVAVPYAYNLSMVYNDADVVGSESNMALSRWNGSAWTSYASVLDGDSIATTQALTNVNAPLAATSHFTAQTSTISYYRSVASGSWHNAANWEVDITPSFSAPVAATVEPSAANSAGIIISSGDVITFTSAVTTNDVQVLGTLVNNTNAAAGITVGGLMSVGANAVYEHKRDGGVIPFAYWDSTATLLVTGAVNTNITTTANQTFGKIEWNSTSQTSTVSLGLSGTNTVSGDFDVVSTGTGTMAFANAATAVQVLGDLNVEGTSNVFMISTGSSVLTLNLAGHFNMSSTSTFARGGTGTQVLVFNNASDNKNFNNAGTYNATGISVTINTGAIVTLLHNITNQTVAFNMNGTLYMGDKIISGAGGTFTVANANTSHLHIGHADGLSSVANTGQIQVTGAKTYNLAANYYFVGSVAQSTGNGFPTGNITGSVTFDNPTGVTLSGNITLTGLGVLNLLQGNVTLGAFNLTAAAPTQFNGAPFSNTHMIVTNGTGRFAITLPATPVAAYIYPIGDALGNYTPVTVEFNANNTARTLGVRLVLAEHPNNLGSANYISRYWSFSNNGAGTHNANVTFTYMPTDVVGTEAAMTLHRYNPSLTSWSSLPTAQGTNTMSLTSEVNFMNTGAAGDFDIVARSGGGVFYRSKGSSTWSDLANWEYAGSLTGPWYNATVLPNINNSDKIEIRSGHTVTVSAATTADDVEVNGTLVIASGIIFTLNNGLALEDMVVNGTVVNQSTSAHVYNGLVAYKAGSFYKHEANGGMMPALAVATYDPASTVEIKGITSATAITNLGLAGRQYGNFIWNSIGQTTAVFNLAFAATVTINGNFIVQSTNGQSIALHSGTASTTVVNGNMQLLAGTLLMNNSGTTVTTLNLYGNFHQNGGNFGNGASTGVQLFNLNGVGKTFTVSSGTHTNTLINYAVNANGADITLNTPINPASARTFSIATGATLHMNGNNMVFANAGSLSVSGTLDLGTSIISNTAGATTFSLAATGLLRIGSPDGISITGATGNIQTTSTRTYTAGASFEYMGTVPQIAGLGLSQNAPGNVIINNAAGVTLSNNTTVSNVLTLNQGLLHLNNFNLSLSNINNSLAIQGNTPGVNNMIVTNGTGQLFKSYAVNPLSYTPFVYPVGDTTGVVEYSPATITYSSVNTTGTLGVRVVNEVHPNMAPSSSYLKRYWAFTTGLTTYTYEASFKYNAADVVGNMNDINGALYSSGQWLGYDATNVSQNLTITTTPLTQLSAPLNNNAWTGRYTIPTLYYRSVDQGNWENAAVWETSLDNLNNWIPAVTAPNADNSAGILIRNSHQITINTNLDVDQLSFDNLENSTLIVANGAVVTVKNGLNNDITLQANARLWVYGTLINEGQIAVSSALTTYFGANALYEHKQDGGLIPVASWDPTATLLLSSFVTTSPTALGTPGATPFYGTLAGYGNIVYNSTAQTSDILLALGTNVKGNFTVQSTGTGRMALLNAAATVAIDGDFNFNDGTVAITGFVVNTAGVVTLKGNYHQTGGSFNALLGTGTTGVQTFNFAAGPARNFTVSGGTFNTQGLMNMVVILGAEVFLNSSIDLGTPAAARSFTNNGKLWLGTNVISGGTNTTFTNTSAATATLGVGHEDGIVLVANGNFGNIQTAARTYGVASNYVFYGANANTGTGFTGATTAKFDGVTTQLTVNATITGLAGALVLDSSRVVLNSSNLILSNAAHTIDGMFSANNMIVTNGTGVLNKTIPAISVPTQVLYPIGTYDLTDGYEYSPTAVTFTTAPTGALTARAVKGAHADIQNPSATTDYLKRWWTFGVTSGLASYTIAQDGLQFYYVDGDVVGNESTLNINRWNADWFPFMTTQNALNNVLSAPTMGTITQTTANFILNGGQFTGRNTLIPYHFRTVSNGNWNNPATWEISTDAAFTNPAPVSASTIGYGPNAANSLSILIRNNHQVAVTANVDADQLTIDNTVNSKLTIDSLIVFTLKDGVGNDLTLNANSRLEVKGTLINEGQITGSAATTTTFAANSLYEHSQNGGLVPISTWDATSTLLFNKLTTTSPTALGAPTGGFGNIVYNNPLQTADINLGLGTTLIKGDFNVQSTGTGKLALTGSAVTMTVNGNFNLSDGIVGIMGYSGSSAANFTLVGHFNQTGGEFNSVLNTATGIQVFTFAAGPNRNYSVTGVGTFNTLGRMNFVVNVGAEVTLQSSIDLVAGTGTSSNTRTFTNNGTLWMGANLITGGVFTAFTNTSAIATTLGVGHAEGIEFAGDFGNIRTASRAYGAAANYVYNGTTAQVTGNGLHHATIGTNTSTNLTINNTAGVTQQNAALTSVNIGVSGQLILANGTYNIGGATGVLNTLALNGAAISPLATEDLLSTIYSNMMFGPNTNANTDLYIPASIDSLNALTINIAAANSVTLNGSLSVVASVNAVVLTQGKLNTTSANLLTVEDGATTALNSGSTNAYVIGPLKRKIDIVTNATYRFPVGKSVYSQFELVNLNTDTTGYVIAEAFDENAGGAIGIGLGGSLNTNRYWKATPDGSFILSTNVRLTEPAMNGANRIARSANLAGVYNSVGGNGTASPILSVPTQTLTEPVSSALGYFALANSGMVYASSTTNHPSTAIVAPNSMNVQILRIQIVTTAGTPALDLTALDLSTFGTDDVTAILNAKVYYTGTTNTFGTTTQYGSTIMSPSGTFSVTGSQALSVGTNYFWLVYDLASAASLCKAIDATCEQIHFANGSVVPSVTSPAGNRTLAITYCTPGTGSDGQCGDLNYTSASIGSVNILQGATSYFSYSGGTCGYSTYYNLSGNNYDGSNGPLLPGQTYTINVIKNGGSSQRVRMWVDWNNDGDFSDSGEMLLNTTSSAPSVSVTIPSGTAAGCHRLRIGMGNSIINQNDACDAGTYGFTSVEYRDFSINVGEGCVEPTVAATNIGFNTITTTSTNVTFTRGNGTGGAIVVARQGSAVNSNPQSGTTYVPNTVYGSGAQIGTGNFVVYNSNTPSSGAVTVPVTGLTPGQTYHFAVYEYNASSNCYQFTALAGSVSIPVCIAPTAQASGNGTGTINATDATITWSNNGNGDAGVIVLMRSCAAVNANPAQNTNYTANSVFGSGSQIGTGNYIVYKGTGSSVTVTGLAGNTTYYYTIYTVNAAGPCYMTPGISGSFSTLDTEPMVLLSNAVTQVTGNVAPGSQNQAVLRIAMTVSANSASPLQVSNFDFTTLALNGGTTDPADILNAKVFYTGTSSTFAATNQFGSTLMNPDGDFSITGSQTLVTNGGCGGSAVNYFWLTYDILNTNSCMGTNIVDARCLSFDVSGDEIAPGGTGSGDPSGSRTISGAVGGGGAYCTPSPGNGGLGWQSNHTMSTVSLAGTGSTFSWTQSSPSSSNSPNNYIDNTSYSGDVLPGQTYTLNISRPTTNGGFGSEQSSVYAWVDWNNDGDFTDLGEQLANGSGAWLLGTSTLTGSGSLVVPSGLVPGTYRIRTWIRYSGTGTVPTSCNVLANNSNCGQVRDFTINVLGPDPHNLTGANSCGPVTVGLDGSDVGVTYQLMHNDVAVGSPIAGTGSAVVFPVQTAVGTYTVRATDGSSYSSNMCGSVVRYSTPTAVITGNDIVCPADGVLLSASTSIAGSGSIASIQWLFNGSDILDAGAEDYLAMLEGDYSVVIESSYGCVDTSAVSVVEFLEPVVIVVAPEDATVNAGDDAVFSIAATGSGTISYQWQVFDTDLSTWVNLADDVNYNGTTTDELTVLVPSIDMSGNQYRVVVSNDCGSTISDDVTLTIVVEGGVSISVNATALCSGGSTQVVFSDGPAYGEVTYTLNGGANQYISLDENGEAVLNTGVLYESRTYALVSVLGEYSEIPVTGSVSITVSSEPEASAGADIIASCDDASVTLSGASASGGTILWTTSGNGTFNNATLQNPVYTLGTMDDFSLTLTMTITGGVGCGNAIDQVVINIAQPIWYVDADGDGYGDASATPNCTGGAGYVDNNLDFCDSNAALNPATVWWVDNDGDSYGVYAQTVGDLGVGCATTYNMMGVGTLVILGGDCNDTNANIHPGATEVCHNGIDDNCNGIQNEGGCPAVAPPANDNPLSSNPNLGLPTNVYPNCVEVAGTTIGATTNPATGTRDVWYRFEAISNGVSVQVSSTVIDPIIYLFDASNLTTPLNVENIITGTGTEILNFSNLTAGNWYRIAIASASEADGTFSICARQLRVPQCQTSGTQSMCAMAYSAVTGAPTTTVTMTDVVTSVTTSHTFSGNSVQLSTPSLGLRYESGYNVHFTATYPLVNGLGQPEVVAVPGTSTCTVTIAPHALIEVKANSRCSSTTLARTAVLNGNYLSGANCNFSNFRFEFTPVDNCAGANPRYDETFTKTVTATAPNININYAFNQMSTSSYPATGYWLVRIRPRFTGYEGEYGPAHVIAVRNTATASGMALEPNMEPAKGVNTMGNIDANIYPNPNNGELVNLNITGITSNEVYVRVLDSMGREVYTNRYSVDGTLNTMVSFTRPLAQGVYMVEMRAGEEVKTQRMIVTK